MPRPPVPPVIPLPVMPASLVPPPLMPSPPPLLLLPPPLLPLPPAPTPLLDLESENSDFVIVAEVPTSNPVVLCFRGRDVCRGGDRPRVTRAVAQLTSVPLQPLPTHDRPYRCPSRAPHELTGRRLWPPVAAPPHSTIAQGEKQNGIPSISSPFPPLSLASSLFPSPPTKTAAAPLFVHLLYPEEEDGIFPHNPLPHLLSKKSPSTFLSLSLYSNSKEALALFQIHPSTPKSISN